MADNNMHSGIASGICPNPFQIMMNLLQRLQDFQSQHMHDDFQVSIPEHRKAECRHTAKKVPLLSSSLPMLKGLKSIAHAHEENENYELLLNNFWRPTLSVTGFEGLPNFEKAGNVVYQMLKLRCSLRLPPTLDSAKAAEIVKAKLTEPEQFNSQVEVVIAGAGNGFDAPKLPDEIENKFNEAHKAVFGEANVPMFVGCGGSIPFMEVFDQNFPGTNFLLTGCGFLDCNAHSANENLDLEFCRKLTTVISLLLSKL